MLKPYLLQALWAMLSTVGFALMYQMRSRKLLYAALGGVLSWSVYYLCKREGLNETLCYAVSAGTGTLFSEIMARALKTPVTVFVIPVNIANVPGGALFHSLLGLMEGDSARFFERGKYAFGVFGAMALGIFTATMLFRIGNETLKNRHIIKG